MQPRAYFDNQIKIHQSINFKQYLDMYCKDSDDIRRLTGEFFFVFAKTIVETKDTIVKSSLQKQFDVLNEVS